MPDRKPRFTLEIGRWYGAEFIGDEFREEGLRSYSPIRVDAVKPSRGGQREFELLFFHLNYPAGVQGKSYTLRTLERGAHYLLARSTEHDPVRMLLIHEISWAWVEKHFQAFPNHEETGLQRWLSSRAGAS